MRVLLTVCLLLAQIVSFVVHQDVVFLLIGTVIKE